MTGPCKTCVFEFLLYKPFATTCKMERPRVLLHNRCRWYKRKPLLRRVREAVFGKKYLGEKK
ncbi:hypothetical protein Dalk_4569 [Desulfatibacillum aliphaticivorans]|uniref:Uncharacterized protein n=1 Tax=Desulfatibacillum aliphaticivorans TaxID=218208 RepID=B8FNG6_DESAL|nr:hypothetical protein Dalk_4569 [Desulfatibacillum aliphaticivorans]